MKTVRVFPSSISGTIHAPPSKSETHREFILSAMANGTSVIMHPLLSADTLATLAGIQAFGAKVCLSSNAVSVVGGNLHPAKELIDCRNSGTTLRMLVALAATLEGTTRFTGDTSLMNRPMDPLFRALESCGAAISRNGNVIAVTGPISPRLVEISGNISSQFVSALLIVGCSIRLTTPLVSAPYVAMTVLALGKRGRNIIIDGDTYLQKSRTITQASRTIAGDWSSAAYLLAAGAIAGSVTVTGISSGSEQGDKKIVDILEMMGAEVTRTEDSVTVSSRPLHAIDCNLEATPDLFPVVAMVAAHAVGTSRLYGVAHLIYKESNRLQRTADMLAAMGVSLILEPDGCRITGSQIHGALLSAAGDHRIFMAEVVAGLSASGCTEICDADEGANVSYPTFLRDIRELGGLIR